MFKKEVDQLNEKIDKGTARPCFAVDFLQGARSKKEYAMDETHQIYVLSGLIEAGSDTTRTAVIQMMAAAACYPEWAATARKLLDEVCGANAERLPVLADRPAIPYITAVMKETLRWRPFLQTGVPHVSTEDIEYEGYTIPAGSDFTWNAYNIALDEREYKDAKKFEPERFMNKDLNTFTKGHWGFGAGTYRLLTLLCKYCQANACPLRPSCVRWPECWGHQPVDRGCNDPVLLRHR